MYISSPIYSSVSNRFYRNISFAYVYIYAQNLYLCRQLKSNYKTGVELGKWFTYLWILCMYICLLTYYIIIEEYLNKELMKQVVKVYIAIKFTKNVIKSFPLFHGVCLTKCQNHGWMKWMHCLPCVKRIALIISQIFGFPEFWILLRLLQTGIKVGKNLFAIFSQFFL